MFDAAGRVVGDLACGFVERHRPQGEEIGRHHLFVALRRRILLESLRRNFAKSRFVQIGVMPQ